jgi:protein-tyrosine phosphatase
MRERMNLSWLSEGLAVGARVADWARLRSEHRIDSVVDVRSEQQDDPELLARHGLTLLQLPTADHHPLTARDLAAGVAWVQARLDAGERVYVHCEHGIGRSVLLCWCVLVAQGLSPRAALERIKSARTVASPSPAQIHALLAYAQAHCECLPTWDELAAIAYAHLQAEA